MTQQYTLISHTLCPYVQRAAIVLAEKKIPCERRNIDLSNKPDWFHRVSPLGKTPVLLVAGTAIFESAVICEYLEDTEEPRLHPEDALQRAQHRAWIEFGSALLNSIWAFYTAPDALSLAQRAADIRRRFEQLEPVVVGPYFQGERFCVVDAAYGPVFRYFDVFDEIGDFGFWNGLPQVCRWRAQLQERPSVIDAVSPDYPALLLRFLLERGGALAKLIQDEGAAIATRIVPARKVATRSHDCTS